MERAEFQVEIDILPADTPLGVLADILSSLERSIIDTAESQNADIPDLEEALVSIVEIQESSNRLTISVLMPLVLAASTISKSIQTEDFSGLPIKAHRALYDISQKIVQNNWTFSFKENNSLNIPPSHISSDHPVPDPIVRRVGGNTTVYGRCMRVGGVKPRAEIRLQSSGKILYVDITEEIARKLARCLYDEVALEGKAVWEPGDWDIKGFEANRLVGYRPTGDPLLAFKELAEAAGDRWDEIDAEEYVRDLRTTSGEHG